MKKLLIPLLAVYLLLLLPARAQDKPASAPSGIDPADVARTISLITGVAISPLLGVSAVGAYEYYEAKTPERRAKLSWYARPEFFVPALILVGLCFIKDTAGAALPTVLKKPFDILETIEHKISGLVATGAFVPLAVTTFHSYISKETSLTAHGFAAIDPRWLYDIAMVPVSMVAFFLVFLASNAINILILLSPFATVDLALKAFRTAVLASVAVSAWMNPWIGAVWAVIVIAVSYFIGGWSFRLTHFGLYFLWDLFTLRSRRFTPDKTANPMFLGRKIGGVPGRTYGILRREEKGGLVLNYRPWLVMPPRSLTLPEGQYAVGKGIFYSEIMRVEGEQAKTACLLPPRYRSHEEQVSAIYGLAGVRPAGFRAAWVWFKDLFGPAETVKVVISNQSSVISDR